MGDASGGETEQPTWLAGNVGGAWRIGGQVHRTTGPWTAAVHALLGFLASRLEHTPGVLGFDEQGREVLSFRRICSVYGGVHPAQIADAVPGRIQMMLDWIPAGAAAGDAGLRRLMSQSEPERSQAALSELVPKLRRIRRLLH